MGRQRGAIERFQVGLMMIASFGKNFKNLQNPGIAKIGLTPPPIPPFWKAGGFVWVRLETIDDKVLKCFQDNLN